MSKRIALDHFREFQTSFVLSLGLYLLDHLLKSKTVPSQYYTTLELQMIIV